jgi:hypothetical protein
MLYPYDAVGKALFAPGRQRPNRFRINPSYDLRSRQKTGLACSHRWVLGMVRFANANPLSSD